MPVTTYNYTGGSDPANKWDTEANAWDGVDGTEAYYDIPAQEDNENNRLEGETNSAPGSGGTITKVEIGVECRSENSGYVHGRIRPEFNGVAGASNDQWDVPTSEATRWYDVTNDANAPSPWSWADVQNLDARVWMYNSKTYGARWARVDQIYVRVTYGARRVFITHQ